MRVLNKKTTVALLLSAVLFLGLAPVQALAANPAPWADDAVNALNSAYGGAFTADDDPVSRFDIRRIFDETLGSEQNGIITSPDGNATRGEVCEAVWAMSGLALPQGVGLKTFEDTTPDDVGIGSLAALGIVNGRGNDKFEPDDETTNAELAIIIYRTMLKMGGSVENAKDMLEGTGRFFDFDGFTDVPPGHWAYDGVMYLRGKGIIMGTSEDTFSPDGMLRRGEFAAVICRIKGIEINPLIGGTPAVVGEISDVPPSHWAYIAITHAIDGGYMITDGSGSFRPDDVISRQEMALIAFGLYRDESSYDTDNVNLAVLDRFSDIPANTDLNYKTALAFLVSVGAMNGTSISTLNPTSPTSRAEFGVFLARVLQGIDSSKMRDYQDAVKYALEG